jgi:hypothetical protein
MIMIDAAARNSYSIYKLKNNLKIDSFRSRKINLRNYFKIKLLKMNNKARQTQLERLGILILPNVLDRIEAAKEVNYRGVKQNLKCLLLNFINQVSQKILK